MAKKATGGKAGKASEKKARAPKKAKAAKAAAPEERAPETRAAISTAQMPSLACLQDLAQVDDRCKDRAAKASGELGQLIKDYAEKQNLDNVSWGLANRFRRMAARDPIKARARYEQFMYIMEKLKIEDAMAAQLPNLDDDRRPRGKGRKADAAGEPAQASSEPRQTDLEDITGRDPNVGEMELTPETEAVH